MTVKNILKI